MSRRARGSSPQRVESGASWAVCGFRVPRTPPHGCVEELESSPPCHGGDRGFKSRHGRNSLASPLSLCTGTGGVRQQRSSSSAGERRAYNADVGGSNPSGTTSAVLSRWWAQRPVKPSLRTCRFNSGHRDQDRAGLNGAHRGVAQLGLEHPLWEREVARSNRVTPTDRMPA